MKCHLQFQKWDPVRERTVEIRLPRPVVLDRIDAVPGVGELIDPALFDGDADAPWRVRSRVFTLISEPHFADWRFDVMLVVEEREDDDAPYGRDSDGQHDDGAYLSLDG